MVTIKLKFKYNTKMITIVNKNKNLLKINQAFGIVINKLLKKNPITNRYKPIVKKKIKMIRNFLKNFKTKK